MREERSVATTRLAAVLAHKDAVDRLCFSHQTTSFVILLNGFGGTGRELGAVSRCGFDARRARAQMPTPVDVLRRAAGIESADVGALARIAHKERNAVAHHVFIDQVQHGGIDHFAQNGIGLFVGIALREHLSRGGRGCLRAVSLNIGDGRWFASKGVVDKVLGIDAELVVEQVLVESGNTHQVVDTVLFEPRCHAGTDAPDIGNGAVGPDLLAKGFVIELADAAGHVFGGDIERHFCLE